MKRIRISFAVLFILVGVFYAVKEFFPAALGWMPVPFTWPMNIAVVGLAFTLTALVTWMPSFWVPGMVLMGIGGLLWWQNDTGNWASWSYAWTLLPAFSGLGLLIFGLFGAKKKVIISGLWNIFGSLILFGIFSTIFAEWSLGAKLWPVGLILLGLIVIVSGMLRKKD